tara:strand:- start:623 stop:895 length:273 start_codon:yes stop_codon:yes gene_type:complete
MKNWIKILGLTFLIFILITLITMKIETPFDGNDTYGFPFTFHKTLGGRRFPIPENYYETHIWYLVIDFAFSGVLALGILNLCQKLKRRNK